MVCTDRGSVLQRGELWSVVFANFWAGNTRTGTEPTPEMKPQNSELGRDGCHRRAGVPSPLKQRQLHLRPPECGATQTKRPQRPSSLSRTQGDGRPLPHLSCFGASLFGVQQRKGLLSWLLGAPDDSSRPSLLPSLHTKQQEPGGTGLSPGRLAGPPTRLSLPYRAPPHDTEEGNQGSGKCGCWKVIGTC